MVFRSNPQFIFDDSQGFECGSVDELKTVQEFIKKRASGRTLAEQLHAIWCGNHIPTHVSESTHFQTSGLVSPPTTTGRSWLLMRYSLRNAAPEKVCGQQGASTRGIYTDCLEVPVIAIFTKFDGLITTTNGELRQAGLSIRDAKKQAPTEAENKLKANFIAPLMATTFPPVAHVHLKGELVCLVWRSVR